MSDDIKKINKQVASFILLSLALSAPVIANNNNIPTGKNVMSFEDHFVVAKYGAPQMPIRQGGREDTTSFAISMYAAPQIPIEEIRPQDPQPLPPFPVILRYAAPSIPIKPPIEKIRHNSTKDLNNSLINIENNINKTKKATNYNTPAFMAKTDIAKESKNLDKINNIAKNPDKSLNSQTSRVQAGEFIYTNYGNYKTIEPLSYSFFK